MKKLIIFSILSCLTIISCRSLKGDTHPLVKDKLNAEMHLMKKNLNLALAENAVVKTENRQYKSEGNKLKKTISELDAQLESLDRKYIEDTSRMTENYQNLSDEFMLFEAQSNEKIKNLTDQNAMLLKKFSEEVGRLKMQLKKEREEYSAERELTRSKYEAALLALEKKVALSNEQLAKAEAVIKSMQDEKAEAAKKITELENKIKELDRKNNLSMPSKNQPDPAPEQQKNDI